MSFPPVVSTQVKDKTHYAKTIAMDNNCPLKQNNSFEHNIRGLELAGSLIGN